MTSAFKNVNHGAASTFSSNFIKNLQEISKNNVICSPLSVDVVLAMLSLGAKGKTLEELRSGLDLPADKSSLKSDYETLHKFLKGTEEVKVKLANKIFNSEKIELLSDFNSDVKEIFQSEVQTLDYSDPVKAAKTVNDWAAENTNHKINDLLSPDAFTAESALILVNAIYFKGPWETPFQPEDTAEKDFSVDDSTKIKVPTMYNHDDFNFGSLTDLKAKWVELPFKNREYSMLIILPDEVNGLSHVQKNIDKINLVEILKSGREKNLYLYMPKFKTESELNLKETLQKMGIGDIFDEKANFSGMSKAPLKVSDAIQKAFINVDEAGCEAAASTGLKMVLLCMKYPEDFRIDRPFLYYIVHKEISGKNCDLKNVTPLFFGSVRNPQQ